MKFEFVPHSDCSSSLLEKIAALKSQYWNYPIPEQIRWFNANLLPEDVHVTLFDGDELIAYLTLVTIEATSLLRTFLALGVGSVCVDRRYVGRNFGFLVMQLGTYFIKRQKSIGFLLCRDELVPFYQRCNWKLFDAPFSIPNFDRRCNLLASENLSKMKIAFSKPF